MKKLVVLLLVSIVLTGCGPRQINLTEDQTTLVARYAADCLLKYQKNYAAGLMDAEEIAAEEKKEAKKLEIQEKVKAMRAAGEENGDKEGSGEGGTKTQAKTLNEVLQLSDFDIQYTGYEVTDQYLAENADMPEAAEKSGDGNQKQAENTQGEREEEPVVSLNARPGKKLIVLKFRLQNLTGEDKQCDVISLTPKFKITVNEEKRVSNMLTMLSNDLASYSEVVSGSSFAEVVLIGEIGEEYANNITALSLKASCGEESATLPLL